MSLSGLRLTQIQCSKFKGGDFCNVLCESGLLCVSRSEQSHSGVDQDSPTNTNRVLVQSQTNYRAVCLWCEHEPTTRHMFEVNDCYSWVLLVEEINSC